MEEITSNRRHFCKGLLSAGALLGVGCPHLRAAAEEQEKHKFQMDSKMSFEQVFDFSYPPMIVLMRALRARMDPQEFTATLEGACDKVAQEMGRQSAQDLGQTNLAAWASTMKKPDHFWQHVVTREIVEDSAEAFEVKITECLWCKTFRALQAADLGYTCICRSDAAMARAFNPKLTLIRTKTLMQGDDHCNHRYVDTG